MLKYFFNMKRKKDRFWALVLGILLLGFQSCLCFDCRESELGFSKSVELKCVVYPDVPHGEEYIRVTAQNLRDYSLYSDESLYLKLAPSAPPTPVNIIEQHADTFRPNEVVGVALDGVPIVSGLLASGVDGVSENNGITGAVDYCGGQYGDTAEGTRYSYRIMPACIYDTGEVEIKRDSTVVPAIIDKRRRYVASLHELIDEFQALKGPRLLGYSLSGYPIYSPLTERGIQQTGMDNCNGKFVDEKFEYFARVDFPYLIGCEGPGEYPHEAMGVSADEAATRVVMGKDHHCPGGRYPSPRDPSICFVCSVGTYCPKGSVNAKPCPAGRWGNRRGEASPACSGKCKGGFYCPEGSVGPEANSCGNSSYFCPAGSAHPNVVEIGFYSVTGHGEYGGLATEETLTRRVAQKRCRPGHFCPLLGHRSQGIEIPLPPGVYGDSDGLTTANGTALCPEGYYCPLGSVTPTVCPRGTYGATLGLADDKCSGKCDAGHWCEAGSTTPTQHRCPAGYYGASTGSTSRHCSGNCEPGQAFNASGAVARECKQTGCSAGFFCPSGSTSATQRLCGGAHLFCPPFSALPVPVTEGYYTTGPLSAPRTPPPAPLQHSGDEQNRTSQTQCEGGFFCQAGKKFICPRGHFGSDIGMTDGKCSGECDPGYFCDEGATTPTQNLCGGPEVYCPRGSFRPTLAPRGFYTQGLALTTRHFIVACDPGHFCIGGIKRPCAAGRYSANGSPSEECDGLCDEGFWCESASPSPRQHICSGGRYGVKGSGTTQCTGACLKGYYCPAGSSRPYQNECGDEYHYCPAGSVAPMAVETGFYSTGGNATTRFAQEECHVSEILGTPPAADSRVNLCPDTLKT
jgi:hypothetical protein